MKVLVTGARGFIAQNLLVHIRQREDLQLTGLDRSSSIQEWEKHLKEADIVFHLAGINRPPDPGSFQEDNTRFTAFIVDTLEKRGHPYKLIFSSSTQATLDNPYGKSKKAGEDYIRQHAKHGEVAIYRLHGVFGKWCKPNYNSVVATFCHNVAHNLPLEIRDPAFELRLIYIDDVIRELMKQLDHTLIAGKVAMEEVRPEYTITLAKLADTIRSFQTNRNTLYIPHVGDGLEKALYSTWLTYLPAGDFSYNLELKTDSRGSLFELLKGKETGQIFVSTTLPNITRGNHYHHTKTEKFVVIQGKGLIRFRSVLGKDIIEYEVNGTNPVVVDIPPGYTHNITNIGDDVMITLFWANEVFDAQNPDTFFEKV